MRFTMDQYVRAIESLQDGMKQLEPDGNCCSICGDGHMAFECGHNPLVAIALCVGIAKSADKLHEHLHYLAGYDFQFGVQVGPAKVVGEEVCLDP